MIRYLVLASAAVLASNSAAPGFDLQGHRGGRGLFPENTLVAFEGALGIGVSTFELDTAVTRDGVVIVSHDSQANPDITRTAEGKWLEKPGPAFFTMDYADVARYDVGRIRPATAYALRFRQQQGRDAVRIPRLSDLFAMVAAKGDSTVRFNIETKLDPRFPEQTPAPEAFAAAVVRVIRDASMTERSTIQSFDWRTLKVVQRIAPEIATVCLTTQQGDDDNIRVSQPGPSTWTAGLDVDDFGGSVPRLVKAAGCAVWSPNALDVTPERIVEAQRLGLRVIPWTVNEPPDMERLIRANVDGLISDRPDLLRGVLTQLGRAVPPPVRAKP